MSFGQRLRKLREGKKLTQKQLSIVLNVSESAIGMYERGEREPNIDTINRITSYFEINSDYLLGRIEEPQLVKEPASKYEASKTITENDFHFFDTEGVQFIARSKKNLSPQAFQKMQELAKKAKELFADENKD